MHLWDSNILRHYATGHATLDAHLQRVSLTDIALPSIVVAEVLCGRCEYALKAELAQLPLAHALLLETWRTLEKFQVIVFDEQMAASMAQLQKQHRSPKRYPDMMIAAMALVSKHVVVTRNQQHFADLLPPQQLQNWIDDPPH